MVVIVAVQLARWIKKRLEMDCAIDLRTLWTAAMMEGTVVAKK